MRHAYQQGRNKRSHLKLTSEKLENENFRQTERIMLQTGRCILKMLKGRERSRSTERRNFLALNNRRRYFCKVIAALQKSRNLDSSLASHLTHSTIGLELNMRVGMHVHAHVIRSDRVYFSTAVVTVCEVVRNHDVPVVPVRCTSARLPRRLEQ
jgi:hypothetical protein